MLVRDQLDPNLDWATLALNSMTFANKIVSLPSTSPDLTTYVDLRPEKNLIVGIQTQASAGFFTALLVSIDPSTGKPITDPSAGFLDPGQSGSIVFSVAPKHGLETDTKIQNQASIIFDANAPISTPTRINTLDNTNPSSHVLALPATEKTLSFPVNWSGSDVGSGIQSFTIYVSDNSGNFTQWLTNTTATHGTYTGLAGHTYRFYSIATDLVGNIQGAKTTAEATTTVTGTSSCAPDISSQVTIARGGFRFDHATNSFIQSVTITNNGAAVSGAALVLDDLPSTATLSNSAGSTLCDAPLGSPWIAIPGTLGTAQSVTMNLTFDDPTNASINYSTRVLAGNGQK